MKAPPCDASLLGLVPCLSGQPAIWHVPASATGGMRAQFFCAAHKPNIRWTEADMLPAYYEEWYEQQT